MRVKQPKQWTPVFSNFVDRLIDVSTKCDYCKKVDCICDREFEDFRDNQD